MNNYDEYLDFEETKVVTPQKMIDEMLERVDSFAHKNNMQQTIKSLSLMNKYHSGQYRKGKNAPAYIIHPLTMACHSMALGIADDNVLAACLLHDVLEDSEATKDDLDVSEEVIKAVELVTFREVSWLSRDESKALYYKNISENKLASIVKVLDRCNNISNMAGAFSDKKMKKYIEETEKYIIPILIKMKLEYEEYESAAIVIEYHMRSLIDTIKELI